MNIDTFAEDDWDIARDWGHGTVVEQGCKTENPMCILNTENKTTGMDIYARDNTKNV